MLSLEAPHGDVRMTQYRRPPAGWATPGGPRSLRLGREPWVRGQEAACEDDLLGMLAGVTAPKLVIVGELDFICGPVQALEIAARVLGCELVIMPGAPCDVLRPCGPQTG